MLLQCGIIKIGRTTVKQQGIAVPAGRKCCFRQMHIYQYFYHFGFAKQVFRLFDHRFAAPKENKYGYSNNINISFHMILAAKLIIVSLSDKNSLLKNLIKWVNYYFYVPEMQLSNI